MPVGHALIEGRAPADPTSPRHPREKHGERRLAELTQLQFPPKLKGKGEIKENMISPQSLQGRSVVQGRPGTAITPQG